MKRYQITKELKEVIRHNSLSFNQLNGKVGFQVRNVLYKNKTIREERLEKLKTVLRLNFLDCPEIKIDYAKNLGRYAFTKEIVYPEKGKDLAEFIGIMLGDGNIYKNTITISFDRRDKIYIDYIVSLTKSLFAIGLKRYDSKRSQGCSLYCTNKNLTEFLLRLGLKRGKKKANQLGIPLWIKDNKDYSTACIKGLMDTDGCVYWCKRDKKFYMNFTNHNMRLLEDFTDTTRALGYPFVRGNLTKRALYQKKEVIRFIKEVKPFPRIDLGIWSNLG